MERFSAGGCPPRGGSRHRWQHVAGRKQMELDTAHRRCPEHCTAGLHAGPPPAQCAPVAGGLSFATVSAGAMCDTSARSGPAESRPIPGRLIAPCWPGVKRVTPDLYRLFQSPVLEIDTKM